MRKQFLHLILFLIFQYYVSAQLYYTTNVTMENIENKNALVTSKEPCPFPIQENINIKGENYTLCDYNFMCHKNENCVHLNMQKNLDDFYDFKQYRLYSYPVCISKPNNDIQSFTTYNFRVNATYECKVFGSCSEYGYKNKYCSTPTCEHNRECYSNNCVNGICMTDENNPAYNCRTQKGSGEYDYKIKCSLLREEKCNSDEECGTFEGCHHNICTSSSSFKKQYYSFYSMIMSIILVLLFIH